MNMITGYQWGDQGQYIGPYTFPNNMDKAGVHLPPKTTLSPPPTPPEGQEPWMDSVTGKWSLRDKVAPNA